MMTDSSANSSREQIPVECGVCVRHVSAPIQGVVLVENDEVLRSEKRWFS